MNKGFFVGFVVGALSLLLFGGFFGGASMFPGVPWLDSIVTVVLVIAFLPVLLAGTFVGWLFGSVEQLGEPVMALILLANPLCYGLVGFLIAGRRRRSRDVAS